MSQEKNHVDMKRDAAHEAGPMSHDSAVGMVPPPTTPRALAGPPEAGRSRGVAGGGMDRRDFLKVATTAAALGACVKTEKTFVSPIGYPDDFVPGQSKWISSTCGMCPAGCGIQVKVYNGDAKKIEGQPDHPVNRGKLCARGQAGLQLLYHPDRLQNPMLRNGSGRLETVSWEKALGSLVEKLKGIRERGESERIYMVTPHVSGSRKDLIREFLKRFGAPEDHHLVMEVLGSAPLRKAGESLFGLPEMPEYRIQDANLVLSLNADFLGTWASPVHYSHAYGQFRQGKEGNRRGWLVHVEPRMSLTASNADVWLAPKPGTETALALSIAHVLVREGWVRKDLDLEAWKEALKDYSPARASELCDVEAGRIETVANDLGRVKPACVIAGSNGGTHSTDLAVAAHLLNWITGNLNDAVRYPSPSSADRQAGESALGELIRLKESLESGQARIVIFIDSDPAYFLPDKVGLGGALDKTDLCVSFTTVMTETSELCDLVLPAATYLESWGDTVPFAPVGAEVMGLVQPAVDPLYESRRTEDVLLDLFAALGLEKPAETFAEYVSAAWKKNHKNMVREGDFESFWTDSLRSGGWWRDGSDSKKVDLPESKWLSAVRSLATAVPPSEKPSPGFPFYLYPYASTKFYDGRHAALPWLQELPDPLTTVVWGTGAELHPAAAAKLGAREGDIVRIETAEGTIEAPVIVYPGIRKDVIGFSMGLGHKGFGRYAAGRGANPIDILSPLQDGPSGTLALSATLAKIHVTGRRGRVVKSQGHPRDMGTEVVQTVSASEWAKKSATAHTPPQPLHGEKIKWGMTVDLDKCTGCGACMVACDAENNIPFVGEEQCAKRRDMRWIRIERYWPEEREHLTGQGPGALFLVMLCQHCENAPCEPVCPVYATSHNQQGLNVMVYDRCVGTRYCSNNCPYKVRYFNFFEYHQQWDAPLEKQHNPSVRVRTDGVMEKCTFCIQRIREGVNQAKNEGRRPVRDGEIVTACQQTCPADAIVFGNLMDAGSAVNRLARDPRGYNALDELNTAPSITYLRKVVA